MKKPFGWMWKSMLTAILLMVLNVAAHIAYMIIFGMITIPEMNRYFMRSTRDRRRLIPRSSPDSR
ncbi:MAG: hypothetical protein IPJ30_06955 [Acidobacteria bacterium]|nr:hypothetical protein [Acidobacteriota bacterium]